MVSIEVGRVAMVRIDDIEVGERARQEMGDLESLEISMRQSGLVMPLCVKEHNGSRPFLLLAGERRLHILTLNGVKEVPVRIYPIDISGLETKTIELAENFYRKDFEYWEYDNLVCEIHELQQQLHGEKISTAQDAPGWGMQETGDLMGISKASVSTAIQRAQAREAFPELFDGCKTQSDASKVLGKLEEEMITRVLAEKLRSQPTTGTLHTLSNSFILKDFFEGVKSIPSSTIHLVEIDPPYAVDLQAVKKKEGSESSYDMKGYGEIAKSDYPEFMEKVLNECYRVMTDHSWMICWFAPEPWFDVVYKLILNAGLSTTRMCGIWTKSGPGSGPGSSQSQHPQIRLANSYEMFFYAWKGSPVLSKAGRSNEFKYQPVSPTVKIHPTERPVELMKDLYETFAFPGSRILIPFLGSGNGLVAAHQSEMSAIGYELNKAYKDSFLVRIHTLFKN